MRERPILFSGEMVRSILDGRKTVTRRVIKRLAGFGPITDFQISTTKGYDFEFRNKRKLWNSVLRGRVVGACPYGQPGGRLWVRETWATDDPLDPQDALTVFFRATDHETCGQPWKPSIHMPRWASRITLEVTGVRVERVQGITQDQAIAEGCSADGYWKMNEGLSCGGRTDRRPMAVQRFNRLWDSIAAPAFKWAVNPWVWVIEFKKL